MEFTARQIASFLNGTTEGDADVKVSNFSKIEEGKPGTLTFLANPKYEHFIYQTDASIVLVNKDFMPSEPIKATLVKVENAYAALAMLLNMVEESKKKKSGVASSAFIAASAKVGENCYIGEMAFIGENAQVGDNCRIYPFAYVGDNCKVGNNTILYPHVTIYEDCIVGNNCILHAGSVVGSDGFGFAPEGEDYKKIPQLGNVVLEDDVEIGANTTIDRAVMESTFIRKGVKLDNLIQIAHNCEIGEHTVMAAQVGIAGSTKVGRHCMFGGQVGLSGHIHIGDHVSLGAQSGVMGSIKDNQTMIGSPVLPINTYMRSNIVIRHLPEMYRDMDTMKKEIEQLKEQINKLK